MSDAAISDFEEFWGSFEGVKTSEKADKKASEKNILLSKLLFLCLDFFFLLKELSMLLFFRALDIRL